MRSTILTATITTGLLAALALTGCTAEQTDTMASATSTPTATAGVADVTGKCVDGEATPVQNGKKIDIGDCKLVDVMGKGNRITAGAVDHLVIEGNGNIVTVASATEVTTIGNGNKVFYKSGDEPKFNERASGNTVRPANSK